ncbi:HdeD family acid-resistance protein [Phytoactinopolyspora limicola]|uniref:HdeD family acid-resistance protein n=1 Tax=Phytoactinopolyspora limicola TaxID=2715536 RepID=UPI001407B9D3|nr:DUF308 domain-containing protein [Phytoactinopolyspora limicola]
MSADNPINAGDTTGRPADHTSASGSAVGLLRRFFAFSLLRGAVYVAVGVLLLFEPTSTLTWLIWLFAIVVAVQGVLLLIDGLQRRGDGTGVWIVWVTAGALSIVAGVVVAAWPDATGLVLLRLVGVWALVAGIIEVVGALRRGAEPGREWTLSIGLLTAVFGFVLLVRSNEAVEVISVLIALYLLFTGIVIIMSSLAVRSATQRIAEGSST